MRDPGGCYERCLDRLVALYGGLADDVLDRPVEACPDWTVRDVLAHLAGGAADDVDGRLDGFPGGAWTGRHVAERAGTPVVELLAELDRHRRAIAASCVRRGDRPNNAWDALVHEFDVRATLGDDSRPVPDDVVDVLESVVAFLATHDVPISVRCNGPRTDVALGPATARDVDTFTAFRAVTSRVPLADVAAWPWDDPTGVAPLLPRLGLFGVR